MGDIACQRLSASLLVMHRPQPKYYDHIRPTTARVEDVEALIGYLFVNTLLCVEGLKIRGANSPLHMDGATLAIRDHRSLTLIGDGMITATVREEWWYRGLSTTQYHIIA